MGSLKLLFFHCLKNAFIDQISWTEVNHLDFDATMMDPINNSVTAYPIAP